MPAVCLAADAGDDDHTTLGKQRRNTYKVS
jgi:hypothetical protein